MDEEKIKSMVFSGGGQTFFSFYGIVKQSNIKKYWNYENLEALYGTSAGAMISVFIALNIEWEVLDNYIIKRPWDKIFNLSMDSLSNIVEKHGLYNIESMKEIFKPLFSLKEMDINITLKEFYDLNHIDLHIYTTEVNEFNFVDLSHKTHPNWKVVDAVYCSSCIPLIFEPYIDNSCCYLDGGFLNDFPLNDCLQNYKEEEVFAIKKYGKEIQSISKDTNLIDFINILCNKSLKKILNKERDYIKNTLFIQGNQVSLDEILNITSSQELRIQAIQTGMNIFDEYLIKNKENE